MAFFPRTRWFQFSLRTLLIVVTLLCVGPGGYLVYQQRIAEREAAAIARLRAVRGAEIHVKENWLWTVLARRPAGCLAGAGFLRSETTDSDIAPVAELSGLVWLDLIDTEVTDDGLVHLSGLTSLRQLRLDETEVTDAGLEHLARLKNLTTLNLYKTRVTDEGVKKLQAALPELEIIR